MLTLILVITACVVSFITAAIFLIFGFRYENSEKSEGCFFFAFIFSILTIVSFLGAINKAEKFDQEIQNGKRMP
jgi:uncharacterized membrane protein